MRIFRVFVAALVLSSVAFAQKQGPTNWPNFGNDPGSTKFSPLTQITPENVSQLKVAWTYDTGEEPGGFRGWAITPLVIDNVMYFPTWGAKLVALNAETGKEIWKFELSTLVRNAKYAPRGISYWPGDAKTPARIVAATTNGLLTQMDAKTGAVIKINNQPYIDLRLGEVEKFANAAYTIGMTPAIYKDLAIFAPTGGEQGRWGTNGDVRAINLRTGKEVWRFHTVPQPGEANFGTWGLNGWQDRKGPGAWVNFAVDVANDLVFVPTGQPTDQNFGATRPGTDLYSSSLVALQASTGKLKWYFQMAHHDTFDWDANTPAPLINVNRDGQKIPAIAQSTKQGLMFIFNRLTGEPLFGVEERPAPKLDAVGDESWPTQPFPIKPEPISRLSMTREEVNKTSPASEKACKALYDKYVQSGPATPYGMVPSLSFPSSEGGGTWAGGTYDPTRQLIFVNTRSLGTAAELRPMTSSGVLPSYSKQKLAFDDPEGYPCSATPWGELMAINADTADIVWRVPLGEYEELTKRGIPKTGTPNQGGSVATASGLVFIGATMDQKFRAFDSKTGKELWSVSIPNDMIATPVTYMGKNGVQYVAGAIGGAGTGMPFKHPAIDTPPNNVMMAFALPKVR